MILGYLVPRCRTLLLSTEGFSSEERAAKAARARVGVALQRISIGDILGDILRNYLQDNLREVSGNLRTSRDL